MAHPLDGSQTPEDEDRAERAAIVAEGCVLAPPLRTAAMNHLDIEQPIFGDRPHIWVQWKGTDVCCDIHCSCGEMSHFDGDFFYFFKCPHCGQHWEVGTHVSIYPVTEAEAIKATDFVKVPQP